MHTCYKSPLLAFLFLPPTSANRFHLLSFEIIFAPNDYFRFRATTFTFNCTTSIHVNTMARKLTSRPGQTHRVLAPRTNLQQVPAPAIPTKAPRSQPAAHRVTKFPHHQTRITTKAPRNLPSFQHLVANSLANGTANYHGAVKVPPPRRNPGHKARKETQQGQKAPEIRGEPERLFYEPYSTSYKSDSETSEDFGDNEMDEDSEDYDTDDDSVTEGEEYISCKY